jgi:uncharacterized membrane protein YfcA
MISMTEQFFLFILVGFVAQFIKGSIGMAFGVISSAFLLSLGISPILVSASVHTASIATTATSGVSHVLFKNVDYRLFARLLIPGVIGSIIGAYVLTRIPMAFARPIIGTYLLTMGLIILYKALVQILITKRIPVLFLKKIIKDQLPSEHVLGVTPLAGAGGFLDAVGGGGWGHIITSSLLAQGGAPHYVIGTVNSVQFFVSVSASATFFFTVGITHWSIILALIIGGVIAAPFAAFMVRRINPPLLMLMAGIIVVALSTRTLLGLIA